MADETKGDPTELARARAMEALHRHLQALQDRTDRLTCEVEALREMLGPEKAREFERRVAEIWKRAERAADRAETEERLRQIAEDAKGRGH
jgi:type VI protein secretion system component VasF